MTTARAEQIEASVDGLGYSSLVVPIGGLATYPTMVLEGTRPLDAVVAVTHEWIHGYLFFSPLGIRYWSSQEARTINETVADLVSRELGRRIARELDLDLTPAWSDTPRPSDVQFRAMLRETRVRLEVYSPVGASMRPKRTCASGSETSRRPVRDPKAESGLFRVLRQLRRWCGRA